MFLGLFGAIVATIIGLDYLRRQYQRRRRS
jgi:hypothetical protein